MFVVVSKFAFTNDATSVNNMRAAFRDRPHLVENAPGFVRLDVLSPLELPNHIWLLTYWADRSSFDEWFGSHCYKASHAEIPGGIRLIDPKSEILLFEHIAC